MVDRFLTDVRCKSDDGLYLAVTGNSTTTTTTQTKVKVWQYNRTYLSLGFTSSAKKRDPSVIKYWSQTVWSPLNWLVLHGTYCKARQLYLCSTFQQHGNSKLKGNEDKTQIEHWKLTKWGSNQPPYFDNICETKQAHTSLISMILLLNVRKYVVCTILG